MEAITRYKDLPTSQIIDELARKGNDRQDIKFNFLGVLDEFRKTVSDEVKQINQLFPEYTPHDEYYHLSRLFFIADKILGENVIASLNATELLILSLALYGHDWGMAVSDVEKELIATNQIRAKYKREDYALLLDEHDRFQTFLTDNEIKDNLNIPQKYWQEYVRNSHALRSGERARKYFSKINAGLGDAVGRVCEGHWLNFKEIEDINYFPLDYSALGESVNLRALAIYVRLVDLFDITQDRTPYLIWKYTAPTDFRSQLEWEKHRAVSSISFPPYQDARIIQVDGATNSHEVFASLTDLKNYCAEQLKGANDILNRMNAAEYNINIFDINWRIHPRGFRPISVQFEFDRIRMFEVLSDEIYEGDVYVFVRELIQNSIDAIKVRRNIYEKNGLDTTLGKIKVDVNHASNGDAQISIIDNGVGMDEYIIRNYLSIAGKSYYNSVDFQKLGLNMDPISKFGVGILSCFMVAECIEIETLRDPFVSNDAEPLKITIPSVNQQFRVQTLSKLKCPVGTKVKVNVLGSKLKHNCENAKLNITDYLLALVDFLDIPIEITEDGRTTTICTHNNVKIIENDHSACMFPWEQAFLPHTITTAKELFKERRISIKEDLKIDTAEGWIVFLELADGTNYIERAIGSSGVTFAVYNMKRQLLGTVSLEKHWLNYSHNPESELVAKSIRCFPQFQVYLDGILVPNANQPKIFDTDYVRDTIYLEGLFCVPYIRVNFLKKAFNLSISRTDTKMAQYDWWNKIYTHLISFLTPEITAIKHLPYTERLIKIVNLIIYNRILASDIVGLVTPDYIPIVIIRNGAIDYDTWHSTETRLIYSNPDNFTVFISLGRNTFEGTNVNKNELLNWNGEDFIFDINSHGDVDRTDVILRLMRYMEENFLENNEVRFIHSPWLEHPPLVQRVWQPKQQTSFDIRSILHKAKDNIELLTVQEWSFARDQIVTSLNTRWLLIPAVIFQRPYEDKLLYGLTFLNFQLSITKSLIKILCLFALQDNSFRKSIQYFEILDVLMSLEIVRGHRSTINLTNENDKLNSLATLFNKLHLCEPISFEQITLDSFVPRTIDNKGTIQYSGSHYRKSPDNTECYSLTLN